jgi:ABC-type Fe3+-hydroxamate transport system substrate-binding protein
MKNSATDQLGRTVEYPFPPKRIISLVPSITELLCDFGLTNEMVGRTKFCIYPKAKIKQITKVGGTKNINIDKIHQIKPELIIANKEENTKEQIELLSEHYPVWISDVKKFDDGLSLIVDLGEVLGKEREAKLMIEDIIQSRSEYRKEAFENIKAIYLIWRKPYMAAGRDTFIHSMLEESGFTNCITTNRYPEINAENISKFNPDIILLSSEPYPFKYKHITELQAITADVPIELVDGEYFSWYGTKMKGAFKYFSSLREKLKQNVFSEK